MSADNTTPAHESAKMGRCFTHRRFPHLVMVITKVQDGRVHFGVDGNEHQAAQSVPFDIFDRLHTGWLMDKETREIMTEEAEDAKKRAEAAKAEEDEALLQRSFREDICFAVTGQDMDEAIRVMERAAKHAYQKGFEEGRQSAIPTAY